MTATTKRKLPRILVFGGACIEQHPQEGFVTKKPIAQYLLDLTDYADEVVFYAQLVHRANNENRYEGSLKHAQLKVVPNARSWADKFFKEPGQFKAAAKDSGVILYLPNALHLFCAAAWLKRHAAAFAIYLANDFESHAQEHRFKGGALGRAYYLNGFRNMMRQSDFIIARGQRSETLAKGYPAPVHQTLPLGHLDLTEGTSVQERCTTPGKTALLFVGKVLWRKGLGELLSALHTLRQRRPEAGFELTVVGDGVERAEVQERAAELGMNDCVSFTGWIDNRDELKRHWGHADMLVMPSSLHKEGVPRVIDEALAQGLPVVATSIGGVEEEFTEGKEALLVPPADAEALAKAIEQMATDSALRQQYVQRGLARIERWRKYGSAGHQHGQLLLACAEQKPSTAL